MATKDALSLSSEPNYVDIQYKGICIVYQS